MTAPAVTALVRVSPRPEAVPQDSVEQKGRQLLTERTLAMEPLGRPTVPVKGTMVTPPARGGTVPQLPAGVSAGFGGRPAALQPAPLR